MDMNQEEMKKGGGNREWKDQCLYPNIETLEKAWRGTVLIYQMLNTNLCHQLKPKVFGALSL